MLPVVAPKRALNSGVNSIVHEPPNLAAQAGSVSLGARLDVLVGMRRFCLSSSLTLARIWRCRSPRVQLDRRNGVRANALLKKRSKAKSVKRIKT
jgi:hypothetical protein